MPDSNQIPKRGEGNHDADAEYRKRTQAFVENEDVKGHAKKAAKAVDDSEEGPELEKARVKSKNVGK